MMQPLPRLLVFVLGLTVLLLVVNLVRKRQLQERYAMLWLLAGVEAEGFESHAKAPVSRKKEAAPNARRDIYF